MVIQVEEVIELKFSEEQSQIGDFKGCKMIESQRSGTSTDQNVDKVTEVGTVLEL